MDIAQAAPALTPDDRAILQALADSETTRPQADIAAAAERDVKTVRERLKRLETAGLVSRPCGARSGFAITPSGMGLLSSTRD
jgi:DNA-binding Lrp family transcriptional regulator